MARDDKSGGNEDGMEAAAESLDALARQYLSLWQDQLTALSANPALSETMASFLAKWPMPQGASTADQNRADQDREGQDDAGSGDSQSPDLAAADRAASVAGGDRLGELLERIDRLEERVARLERG